VWGVEAERRAAEAAARTTPTSGTSAD
jgi:hypothetical protein